MAHLRIIYLGIMFCCCILSYGRAQVVDITLKYMHMHDTENKPISIKCGNLTSDVFFDETLVQSNLQINGTFYYRLEQELPQYISIPIDRNGSYIKVFFGDTNYTKLNIIIKSPLVGNYLTDTIIENETTFQIRTNKRSHRDTLYFENNRIMTHITKGVSHKNDFLIQINDVIFNLRLEAKSYTEIEKVSSYKKNVFRKLFDNRKYIRTIFTKNQHVYESEIYL